METKFKLGEIVYSKNPYHNELTTWKIVEINVNMRNENIYNCAAAHNTKMVTGFDSHSYEFKENEIYN